MKKVQNYTAKNDVIFMRMTLNAGGCVISFDTPSCGFGVV